MKKENKIYSVLKSWVYSNGTKMKKKHGEWIILYLRDKQVCFMDTWNGHIYQAHDNGVSVVDNGFVDCQFTGRIHTVIAEKRYPADSFNIVEAVKLYQLFLKSS